MIRAPLCVQQYVEPNNLKLKLVTNSQKKTLVKNFIWEKGTCMWVNKTNTIYYTINEN